VHRTRRLIGALRSGLVRDLSQDTRVAPAPIALRLSRGRPASGPGLYRAGADPPSLGSPIPSSSTSAPAELAGVRKAIESAGTKRPCLPARGAELNPIGLAFAKRKALPRAGLCALSILSRAPSAASSRASQHTPTPTSSGTRLFPAIPRMLWCCVIGVVHAEQPDLVPRVGFSGCPSAAK
jgi:hypothetical protein